MITNLTEQQVANIQIDEGVLFLDYGEDTERMLAPTRGGGEFNATAAVRDIDFDGSSGKTAGMQVVESNAATLKVTALNMSQENLALAIPNPLITGTGANTVIKNPRVGVIPESAYPKNITMFAKTLGGTYKKITIKTPLHEGALGVKATPKAEGELALEFNAHYSKNDLNGDVWSIEDVAAAPDMSGEE